MVARFYAHVQTGLGAHPASCTMGAGSFPGVKRPGRGQERIQLYLYPPSRPVRPVMGTFCLLPGHLQHFREEVFHTEYNYTIVVLCMEHLLTESMKMAR